MKYYVTINDREFEVDLCENAGRLEGKLNGAVYGLDHAEIERGAKYSIIIAGESFNVSQHLAHGGMDLIVGGHLYQAQVLDEREKGARALESAKDQGGREVIKSLMPGIVRKVFAAEGDEVTPGAPLLILEAMKMENELCAEKAGHVVKVHVQEGQTVNSSDPLVTIE